MPGVVVDVAVGCGKGEEGVGWGLTRMKKEDIWQLCRLGSRVFFELGQVVGVHLVYPSVQCCVIPLRDAERDARSGTSHMEQTQAFTL